MNLLEELNKRKALYPDWKISGIPVRMKCPSCSATCLRAMFSGNGICRIICETCGTVVSDLPERLENK